MLLEAAVQFVSPAKGWINYVYISPHHTRLPCVTRDETSDMDRVRLRIPSMEKLGTSGK